MGKVMSSIRHPFRNFNVEDRAHKVISKNKPIPAPRHTRDEETLQKILKEHPEIVEENLNKNIELEKNLRSVYVTSLDHNPEIATDDPNRPLPTDRRQPGGFDFGVKEPNKVPAGKVTLRSALKFLTDHQADPNIASVEKISTEHLIPEEKLRIIIKYFKVFQMYIPNERKPQATFIGPAITRTKVEKIPLSLPEGKIKPQGSKKDDT